MATYRAIPPDTVEVTEEDTRRVCVADLEAELARREADNERLAEVVRWRDTLPDALKAFVVLLPFVPVDDLRQEIEQLREVLNNGDHL